MSFIAAGIGAAGTLGAGIIGAATQGPGPVQPIKLQYANDVQNMLMPLVMQDVAGWGTNVPQQYLQGSANKGNDLSHMFQDYYNTGANAPPPISNGYGGGMYQGASGGGGGGSQTNYGPYASGQAPQGGAPANFFGNQGHFGNSTNEFSNGYVGAPVNQANIPVNMFNPGGGQGGLSMGGGGQAGMVLQPSMGQMGMGGNMNGMMQQTQYAPRPQFGQGGGNMGTYNGGWAGSLK